MTSEEAKKYLGHLLTAYTELMKADADYRYLPYPHSKLTQLLRDLQEEISIAKRIAKQIIKTEGDD